MEEYWNGKNYAFYSNTKCEYFPCHPNVLAEDFNCLFCYCPLFMLGDKCGGAYQYMDNGIKDCSNCTLPHQRKGYGHINDKFQDIIEEMKKEVKEEERGNENG